MSFFKSMAGVPFYWGEGGGGFRTAAAKLAGKLFIILRLNLAYIA